MFGVNNMKKCHFASFITTAENVDKYDYRELFNNFATLYIAKNVCCSSEAISVFRFHMDVFLCSLVFGCCVDIHHYAVHNILSNATRLFETDITLLL